MSGAANRQSPEPYGLGYPVEVIERIKAEQRDIAIAEIVKTVKPIASHGGDRKSRDIAAEDFVKATRRDQVDIINLKHKGGTGAEYLLARLKRDAPEIAEAVERGEYKLARAAGIASTLNVYSW